MPSTPSVKEVNNYCRDIENNSLSYNNFEEFNIDDDLDKTLTADGMTNFNKLEDSTEISNINSNDENFNSMNVQAGVTAFEKHLFYPKPFVKSIAKKEKAPMSVSSIEWKNYYKKKEQLSELKKAQIEKNKEKRRKRRLKVEEGKQNRKSKKVKHPKKKRIQCPTCSEDVVTDAEDDAFKNIGCDGCDKWYHLKCTSLHTLSFVEAEKQPFLCNVCFN